MAAFPAFRNPGHVRMAGTEKQTQGAGDNPFKRELMRASILFAILINFSVKAQVGIGTTTPHPSALLELTSGSKGLLLPRVALQSSADGTTVPAPANSLLVYNTAAQNDVLPGFYYWQGSWMPLLASSSTGANWSLNGNTVTSGQFLGTVNFAPFNLKVNNQLAARVHPNGGLALGFNAAANDSNSLALGSGATATASTEATAVGFAANAQAFQATAIGHHATASGNNAMAAGYMATASGFQSLAMGQGSSASQNNTTAVGYSSTASAYQSAAFGTEASASGQSATAIGFQATATQANSVILGSSSNTSNKVGIGTNTPDERLHVNGSLKLTDGTQANGYLLTSDAGGKASWQNPNANKAYAAQYYNANGQTMNLSGNVSFGMSVVAKNTTNDTDGITVSKTGVYRITYSVSLNKSSGAAIDAGFLLYKDYSTAIPASYTIQRIANNSLVSFEKTVITTLNAYQKVSLRPTVSDSNTQYVSGGCALTLELIE
jgi:trimeric autotransporter adhesin